MKPSIRVVLFFDCLLFSTFARPQVNYNQVDFQWNNNLPNCLVGHNNCWNLSSLTASFVRAGGDGFTAAVDSAGSVHFYNPSTNTWTLQSAMGTVFDLAVGSANEIFALRTDTACGGSPYHRVVKWTGSAWQGWDGCTDSTYLGSLSASFDGTVLVVTGGGNQLWQIFQSSNTEIGATGYVKPDVLNSQFAFIVKQDGSIATWNGGTTLNQDWCGASCAQSVSALMNDPEHPYVQATAGNGGGWAHYNGTGFDYLAGSITQLSAGASMGIWGIGPTQSGSNLWRFPDQSLGMSANINGSVSCNGCSQQTGYVQGYFTGTTHHTGGQAAQSNFAGGSAFNLTSTDTIWDPFDCYTAAGQDYCDGNDSPAYVEDDTRHSDNWSSPAQLEPVDIEDAFTRLRWTGGGGINCSKAPLGRRTCDYPITTYCTGETIPPDWTANPPYMKDICFVYDGEGNCLPPVGFGWDAVAVCARLQAYRGTGKPWVCTKGGSAEIIGYLDDPNTQPADCTHNP